GARRTSRELLGQRRAITVLRLHFGEPLPELEPCLREALGKAEEVFGPEKEAPMRATVPDEAQRRPKAALRAQRFVILDARRTHGREACRRRQPLEERRLPRPILADEEGHRRVEGQGGEGAD